MSDILSCRVKTEKEVCHWFYVKEKDSNEDQIFIFRIRHFHVYLSKPCICEGRLVNPGLQISVVK